MFMDMKHIMDIFIRLFKEFYCYVTISKEAYCLKWKKKKKRNLLLPMAFRVKVKFLGIESGSSRIHAVLPLESCF